MKFKNRLFFLALVLVNFSCIIVKAQENSQLSSVEIFDNPFEDITVDSVGNDNDNVKITDSNQSVLRKKTDFSNSFQIDLSSGILPEEITLNSKYSMLRVSYFLNDEYGFGLGAKTRYGNNTIESENLFKSSQNIDFTRAPEAKNAAFVSFNYNLLYGKISLFKRIAPTTLTQIKTDFGLQNFGNINRPFLRASLDESFFILKRLSLGFGLGLDAAEITDPTSVNVNQSQPIPNQESFGTKIQFNYFYSLNLSFIL